MTAIAAPSQILTTLYGFCSQHYCTDGESPQAGLVRASDGNFYGTTEGGGLNNAGTAFKITPSGMLSTLYSFCSQNGCTDGGNPLAGLVQGSDGNFYGTTYIGGIREGTVFKITPSGTLSTLYRFCSQLNCADGANPGAGLVQASDGNFYGTTVYGGANGYGTVFKITPSGMLSTLYNFCSQTNCTDGAAPAAGLVQASDGNFYGTTLRGGNSSPYCVAVLDRTCGTVFKITPSGMLSTLYRFCAQTNCPDGANPYAGLVHGSDGSFYGATVGGGGNGNYGTVFKTTPSGMLSTLYSFCSQMNCADGAGPVGALVQASDGNFYGTTEDGGNPGCSGFGCGTAFELTPSGMLSTLYSFCSQMNCADGWSPLAGLVQASDGNFYGTTFSGGANYSGGTVFRLVLLRPCIVCSTVEGR